MIWSEASMLQHMRREAALLTPESSDANLSEAAYPFNGIDDIQRAVTGSAIGIRSEHDTHAYSKHWDNIPEVKGIPEGIAAELVYSRQRSQVLLGTPHGVPSFDALAKHTMRFVIRVLRSWLRIMADGKAAVFPPIIHNVQLKDGVPIVLAYCYTQVKMWVAADKDDRKAMSASLLQAIRRLIVEVKQTDHAQHNQANFQVVRRFH
jgi:hypothetical protein